MVSYTNLGHARGNHAQHETNSEVTQLPQNVSVPTSASWVKGRLLLTPRAGLSIEELEKTVKPYGVNPKHYIEELNLHICELPDGADERKIKQILKKDPRLKNVELDMIVTLDQTITDPSFNRSWALPKIEAPTAWDISTGDGIIVAVLDTGVDSTHPDLAANMVPGWNMFDNNDDTADVHNHGTWVAGTIAAAANNAAGSAGVAWSAEIMPVRIAAPDGTAFISTIANGIRWAADHGAKVVNASFSGVAGSAAIQSAAHYLRNKGGVLVVSAGNTGTEFNYPPSYAIMVAAATDSNDQRPSWSSYGSYVDIASPGVSIFTTRKGGGYSFVSGTSFSSPIVAATAALMLSANNELTPSDLDQLMLSTTVDLGEPGFDNFYGMGRVDAAAAVAAASAMIGTDNKAPGVTIISPNGGEVTGIVPVDINAFDDVGVVSAELWVNGQKIITDTLAPFAFAWDSSKHAEGDYILQLHVFDAAGNQGVSQEVLVNVIAEGKDTTPPEITSFNLSDGMRLNQIQRISAVATDNETVVKMRLFINGRMVFESEGNTLTVDWRTRSRRSRSSVTYFVTIEAVDQADNTTRKTVTVHT
ncbi:MAG: S8 family serine peptidase [Nitrosomonas sp.]|nr:S8 family serine peptidase [Nitrosomonas sp.]